MEHYVGYHIGANFRPFVGNIFFTGKADRDTLVGNRLWIIEGADSPRHYALVSSGIISAVLEGPRPPEFQRPGQEMGTSIEFSPEDHYRIDLTSQPWFGEFRKAQQNFRFGLNKINDDEVIGYLKDLWCEATQDDHRRILEDVETIQNDPSLSVTTKKKLVDARVGQGAFRDKLIDRWGGCCAVSGCAVRTVLRASHIKPWRHSTSEERLDPGNGLLLAAHLDALFDAGFISFSDTGEMMLSTWLPWPDREVLQLPRSLRRDLSAAERYYLQHHREYELKR